MTDYDVFNGDADGLCSLVQLRNQEPRDSVLITGVKRDIALLERVNASQGDRITVLDIALDKNKTALNRNLTAGARVFYVDHHYPGEIPEHRRLQTIINETPDVCTSLLVNRFLDGAFAAWAVVGAFGDNLKKSARALARNLDLSSDELQVLENLGIYLNYNGYGSGIDDLHFKPDELFQALLPYAHPLDFVHHSRGDFERLESGYHQDMQSAFKTRPEVKTAHSAVYLLPDQPWARRVSGVFGNDLANRSPDLAHAVLTRKPDGGYQVSVRAPLNNKTGAADLCRQFPSGGGRAAAAGINDLPADSLQPFIQTFEDWYR